MRIKISARARLLLFHIAQDELQFVPEYLSLVTFESITLVNCLQWSRTAAACKMERFVIIVSGLQPSTIIAKCSILDVASVLDPLLVSETHFVIRKVLFAARGWISHYGFSEIVFLGRSNGGTTGIFIKSRYQTCDWQFVVRSNIISIWSRSTFLKTWGIRKNGGNE